MPVQRKQPKDISDADVLHSWLRDVEATYGCRVRVTVFASPRKGCVELRAEACDVADGRLAGVRARVVGAWPSSYKRSLDQEMWNLVSELDKVLCKSTPIEIAASQP